MICNNCILDSTNAPDLILDHEGVCQYCRNYQKKYIDEGLSLEKRNKELKNQIIEIKRNKSSKGYDSIMGLSGGVDSSYLAYLAKQWGLNPLLVHFDNGWNSELAVKNIESIIQYTGFDLYTYVVDWEEFRDLQRSYIKAGVLDWEIPTDHGFYACLFEQAFKRKIDCVLTGHNYQTESILPKAMRWSKLDVANIKDIHKKFGKIKLKTFPLLDFWKHNYYSTIRNFKRYNLLEFMEYNKDEAKEIIKKEMGWRDYGGKHYESIFTRFYQGYVLLEKFGIDKRRAHLSNLILSGQISREEALIEIGKPGYPSELLKEDIVYVTKKLGFTSEEFEKIMQEKPVPHTAYKSYETGLYRNHEKFMQTIKPLTRVIKKVVR